MVGTTPCPRPSVGHPMGAAHGVSTWGQALGGASTSILLPPTSAGPTLALTAVVLSPKPNAVVLTIPLQRCLMLLG